MAEVRDQALGRTSPPAGNPLVIAGIVIIAIVALYVGAGIFVPLVLAILLAFALAPLVTRLRRLRVPNVAAVIIAVCLAGAVLTVIGYVIATQLVKLAGDLPSYQATVATKLKGLQASFGNSDFFDRLSTAVDQLKAQVAPAVPATLGSPAGSPIPVTIANTPDNPFGMVQSILGSVLGPLATAAIVVVFLVFLLLERGDLRDRFLKLVSRGDLRTSTKVMDDAAARVGRYLLVQFSVNLVYGLLLGGGLTVIGVPNGILWGLLATLFRYIPFVGTLIVATIPFTLAFAVDPGWSMLLKSVALFVVLETTATNIIEPRLYGSSTGLSALAVLVAAMFWATLWGPVGLILATPLTVCLVVIGRYVPQLQFLEVLLGSQPVLRPEERLYQRLLAGNTEEASEIADGYSATDEPGAFYAEVAIPALQLAEADLSVNSADLLQRRRFVESFDEVIDDLDEDVEAGDLPARVLIIGGRTELDGVAAKILASVVQRGGTPARVLPPVSLRREALGQLDISGIDAICVVYLGRRAWSYARFVSKWLKRRHPELRVVLALLGSAAEAMQEHSRTGAPDVDKIATTISDAAQTLLASGLPASDPAAEEQGNDQQGLRRMQAAVGADPQIAAFLKDVAEQMNVAVAIATIADVAVDDIAVATREHTLGGDKLHGARRLMDRVAETGNILVVSDAFKDEASAEDAFLLESGVRFYAGVPLRTDDERVVGVLAIMDETVRELDDEERRKLAEFAKALMVLIEMPTLA